MRAKYTFWWLLLENKKGAIYCPFCDYKYSLEENKICPYCHFMLTQSSIKYMLEFVKRILKERKEIELEIKNLSSAAKVEYQSKPTIQIDFEIISKLNNAPIGEKRISYLFCLLLHEFAHILGPELYKSREWSEAELKRGKEYHIRTKFDDVGEYHVRRFVESFLTNKIHEALRAQYEEVKKTLELPDLGLPNASELCSVVDCMQLAMYKCEVCDRKLCEDHIELKAHNPCRYLTLEERAKKKYGYQGEEISNGKRVILLNRTRGKALFKIGEEMVRAGVIKEDEPFKLMPIFQRSSAPSYGRRKK